MGTSKTKTMSIISLTTYDSDPEVLAGRKATMIDLSNRGGIIRFIVDGVRVYEKPFFSPSQNGGGTLFYASFDETMAEELGWIKVKNVLSWVYVVGAPLVVELIDESGVTHDVTDRFVGFSAEVDPESGKGLLIVASAVLGFAIGKAT